MYIIKRRKQKMYKIMRKRKKNEIHYWKQQTEQIVQWQGATGYIQSSYNVPELGQFC